MTFGERLLKLRKSKSMTQEDLAEKLDVTRQTISKWECCESTPDFQYLIEISRLFDVTTDYLLKGDIPQEKEQQPITQNNHNSPITFTKIVGLILLTVTLIAGVLLFLLVRDIEDYFIPLAILLSTFTCSIICLSVKANAGYWCAWAALAPICILSPHIVGIPILTATGITQILIFIVMGLVANKTFHNCKVKTSKAKSILIIMGFLVGICSYIMPPILALRVVDDGMSAVRYNWFGMCIFNYLIYTFLALLLTYSICYVKTIKNK